MGEKARRAQLASRLNAAWRGDGCSDPETIHCCALHHHAVDLIRAARAVSEAIGPSGKGPKIDALRRAIAASEGR